MKATHSIVYERKRSPQPEYKVLYQKKKEGVGQLPRLSFPFHCDLVWALVQSPNYGSLISHKCVMPSLPCVPSLGLSTPLAFTLTEILARCPGGPQATSHCPSDLPSLAFPHFVSLPRTCPPLVIPLHTYLLGPG